ncbi:hypothetical protein C8N40_11337 [Pontibacter mucosus]|uniref:Uncharacterized protein n=1 Tax=Pontibacter mucosus TaxID=1649266 RepID=A0A2T5Y9T2_9BACT|nr:hypothetical protein C8N40_11337 [Pontibacter mucosus]
MLAAVLINLSHPLVDPIVDPDKRNIGCYLLHSYCIIPLYLLMVFLPKPRLVRADLVIHVILDWLKCL